jgi:hypothetical protein
MNQFFCLFTRMKHASVGNFVKGERELEHDLQKGGEYISEMCVHRSFIHFIDAHTMKR